MRVSPDSCCDWRCAAGDHSSAGESWDAFVAHCVAQQWAGVEALSGIPGSVGGTPIQNVGAYGQEVSETIRSVSVYDRLRQRVVTLAHDECQFAYRQSIFNTSARERYLVLSVQFALRVNGAPTLRYAELQKRFAGNAAPSLAAVRAAVLEIRRQKGMVLDPNDADTHSVGSFFKNPRLTATEFESLQQRSSVAVPHFPAGADYKVPAAWLIEQAGFVKGYARGRVAISSKHALALVNRGGATAHELMALKAEIQARVAERFEVVLHPEPVFIGFDEMPLT
jgi:UDP-N-acetylmuramate dehydrogenase